MTNCNACNREIPVEYVRRGRDRTWCVHCEGDRNREQVDRMRDLIRELKANPQSDRRPQIIRDIESLNHPDLPGLLKAIDTAESAPAPRKRYAA